MEMRAVSSILFAGLMTLSLSAVAAEFNNECAWGLANDKHVQTECKVSMTREDGKTYCFSSDKAMDAFMKSPQANMKKAQEKFGRT
jgi:hypothetical protein